MNNVRAGSQRAASAASGSSLSQSAFITSGTRYAMSRHRWTIHIWTPNLCHFSWKSWCKKPSMKSSSSISCVATLASKRPMSSITSPPCPRAESIHASGMRCCVTGPHFHRIFSLDVRERMCLNMRWSPSWQASCNGFSPTPYSRAHSSRMPRALAKSSRARSASPPES